LIFFKSRKEIHLNDTDNSIFNKNLQEIIKTIEEFSDEQREIVEKFRHEMENFTVERSLESCLQALNLSIQLANTREMILDAYKKYCFLLENDLKKLIEERKKYYNEAE
jgi:N-glycosylase/DNA lyase